MSRPRPQRRGPEGLGGGASAPCPGPRNGSGRRSQAGARRCPCGRSLWKPGARVPARAGLTARAAAESAAQPPVPVELSAGRGGGPSDPGRLGEAAGRAGGGPARLGWAARRAVCGPGQARGAGERGVSGSDVRGVSAPNRERGRGQQREGREQERAGGRACRSLRAHGRGRRGRPGLRPLPAARPPATGPRRGPTAQRSCRGCPGRRCKGRAERPVPLLVLKRPPPAFSALRLLPA